MSSAIQTCRSCGGQHLEPILALGETVLADALLKPSQLGQPEPAFPLDVAFCRDCSLVQILETVPPDVLFGRDYPITRPSPMRSFSILAQRARARRDAPAGLR